MARRKNVKRIDPRYFLNETVNRNDDGSRLEEAIPPPPDWRKGFDPEQIAAAKKAVAAKEADPDDDPEDSRYGLANANMYQHDPERDAAERSYNTSHLARLRARAGMEESTEELEEGWDDIKAGAGKAWKKTKRGAEDAWDTVKQTADDVVSSPLDLGKRHRRRRKNRDDERRAASKAEIAQLDRRQAARKAKKDKEAAHQAGVNAEYDRWSNDPDRLAKVDAEQRRSRSRVASDREQYQDSLRVDKHKKNIYDREQEVTGKNDKRYSNTVGSGFEE